MSDKRKPKRILERQLIVSPCKECDQLRAELAELRQRPHPEHDTCPCCISNGQQEMWESLHKAMKKAGVQGLMIAKVFAALTKT